MSDGPSKLAPQEPIPLDDLILADDDDTVAAPPPVRPSSPPPRPSSPAPDGERANMRDSQGRKKAKLTLRIPDDEISRPNLPMTPSGGVAAVRSMTGPPPPFFDDDDGSADDTLELPADRRPRLASITEEIPAAKPRAAGIDPSNERGWTPFQPNVGDEPIQPTPIVGLHDTNGGGHLHEHESEPVIPSAPISEDIPVDMDLSAIGSVPDTSSEEIATNPRLDELDSQEIPIVEGDRVSETGEVEVAPEDLVSVESLPVPTNPALPTYPPPPAKTAGKYPAFKEELIVPQAGAMPTAASLIASTTAVPAPSPSQPSIEAPATQVTPVTPPAAQVQATTPQGPPVSVASVASVASAAAASAQAPVTVSARRQQGPLVFVPPVGALAPPPMTESAAARKKTRPWWEELFNDDFIRTMAKVSDNQIRTEVNFIEESLGCEAGAMILDLACGTGRHAVELATRGYQVVGFDLSLAMLARASDEAQDRKQKINFVQGDMREMTFEETFDGVYSWNTSFGYFDEEKNAAVVARVHKALKKGGQFLLDVVNRDFIIRQAPSLAWFEGDGCICMDEMGIDFITSRMKVKRTLMMDDGRTKEIEYSMRIYSLHELGKMLHDNGFRVAEVSGRTGTPGVFFGCEAPRTLILAEKR
jgi:SAM-dependent methyltransferase